MGGEGPGLVYRLPFSEPEVFDFPKASGPVERQRRARGGALLPRWVDRRGHLPRTAQSESSSPSPRCCDTLDRTEPVRVKGVEVSPRDVVAANPSDPATIGLG